MTSFIIRRLFQLPLVFFGVTIAIVLMMQFFTPAQRAASYVRSEAQLRNLPQIIAQYGLDKPWYVQYATWLREAAQGNLGFSQVDKRPVWTSIRKRFPSTVELAVLSLFPIIGLGIWLGTAAALNRDKFIDQFTRVISIIGWSLPSFVLGIWLLVIFYGGFNLFGIGQLSNEYLIEVSRATFKRYTNFITLDALLNGRFDILWDALVHMVLPVATLTGISSAQIMRVMRSSLLDVLSLDYVRTARAKGLTTQAVNIKHARRNALIPVLTLAGGVLVTLLGGVVITETIFAYPGVGQWIADAAVQRDYASVLGGAVFLAFVIVLINLLIDILYGVVDPRIRYD
jgi:dipeptide transport system permease protein